MLHQPAHISFCLEILWLSKRRTPGLKYKDRQVQYATICNPHNLWPIQLWQPSPKLRLTTDNVQRFIIGKHPYRKPAKHFACKTIGQDFLEKEKWKNLSENLQRLSKGKSGQNPQKQFPLLHRAAYSPAAYTRFTVDVVFRAFFRFPYCRKRSSLESLILEPQRPNAGI